MTELLNDFKFLTQEAKELYLTTSVHHSSNIPSSIEFLRRWVCPNIPILIKEGAKNWPAFQKWTPEYLVNKLDNKFVSVAVTPNGYADAIAKKGDEEYFVLPEERMIRIGDFFEKLRGGDQFSDKSIGSSNGIFYLQKQNSNFIEEFPELLDDIDSSLTWASQAFGEPPTAINLWIGDKRSVTSLHKDPFENIYCVVKGWKEFILLLPTDRPWLPYKTFPVAEYKEINPGIFDIKRKEFNEDDNTPQSVPWITVDPANPDLVKYPSYANCNPMKVRVEAGDLLYLPSLWFHYVSQSDGCIAVNFWFDMEMDIKFVYFQFLEQLTKRANID